MKIKIDRLNQNKPIVIRHHYVVPIMISLSNVNQ